MNLVHGHDSDVAAWVASHIPSLRGEAFGPCAAIGVTDDQGNPVAGVVFHDYQKNFATMQISMAATSPRWASRSTIRALLAYPFLQIGINKVWTATAHTNARALKFQKGIGMTQEGVMRHQFGPKIHAVMHGLTRTEYERRYFPKDTENGQKLSLRARCA